MAIEMEKRTIATPATPVLYLLLNVSNSIELKPQFAAFENRIVAEKLCADIFSPPYNDHGLLKSIGNIVSSECLSWLSFRQTLNLSYKAIHASNVMFRGKNLQVLNRFGIGHVKAFHPMTMLDGAIIRGGLYDEIIASPRSLSRKRKSPSPGPSNRNNQRQSRKASFLASQSTALSTQIVNRPVESQVATSIPPPPLVKESKSERGEKRGASPNGKGKEPRPKHQ